jgi:hypothetical protein
VPKTSFTRSVGDAYFDVRTNMESKVTLDNSAGVICAMMGYADQPSGAFDHCEVDRNAFTGRLE